VKELDRISPMPSLGSDEGVAITFTSDDSERETHHGLSRAVSILSLTSRCL
jgi:hypothetical protein